MSLLDEIYAEDDSPKVCKVTLWMNGLPSAERSDFEQAIRVATLDTARIIRALEKRYGKLPYGYSTLKRHRANVLGKPIDRCSCPS